MRITAQKLIVTAGALAVVFITAISATAAPTPAAKTAQLSGTQLAARLLPARAFPGGYRFDKAVAYNSGNRLETGPAKYRLATMSCLSFTIALGRSGFGETAVARNGYRTQFGPMPSGAVLAQLVYQFARGPAAATFWQGLRTILDRCHGTVPILGKIRARTFTVPVSGTRAFELDVTLTSVVIGTVVERGVFAVAGHDVFTVLAVAYNRAIPTSPSALQLVRELMLRVLGGADNRLPGESCPILGRVVAGEWPEDGLDLAVS